MPESYHRRRPYTFMHHEVPAGKFLALAAIAYDTDWVWLRCGNRDVGNGEPCGHRVPYRIEDAMARFGRNADASRLSKALRCTVCGFKGAVIAYPDWDKKPRVFPGS